MDAKTQKFLHLELERRRREARNQFIKKYENDTPAFVYDLIDWEKIGSAPTPYQMDIWAQSDIYPRLAVMAPRGAGKSTSGSLWVIKNSLTSEIMGHDWKCVSTAGRWEQLEKYLWPEIRLWLRLLKWDKIPLQPWDHRRVFKMTINGVYGQAFAANSDNPGLIEGAHAKRMYYLYDEAKMIPENTFNAIEGTFANANPDKGQYANLLAISTPHFPEGRFWQIMTKQPGYDDWHQKAVSKEELIDAGRITQQYVDDRAAQWGRDSAIFKMSVEGQFPESSSVGVIPRSWVVFAQERYIDLKEKLERGEIPPLPVTHIGMDVGDEGPDLTVFARKYGNILWDEFVEVPKVKRENTQMAVNALIREIEAHKSLHISPDVSGVGTGVYSGVTTWLDKENRRKLYDINLDAFVAKAAAKDDWGEYRRDDQGIFKFADRRSAAWWNFREALNPANNPQICLPPNPRLTKELTAPTWREVANSTIQVESKDELRKAKRLGSSTDYADCLIMSHDSDFTQSDFIGFFVL